MITQTHLLMGDVTDKPENIENSEQLLKKFLKALLDEQNLETPTKKLEAQ
jgi:hypothetical protein